MYAALSALDAFSTKMAVIANNIANINTDDYKKSRAILEERQNGGVDVSIQEIDTPGSPVPYEEGSNIQAQETSNVDLGEEIVQMMLTQRGYEANLKSLQVQDEMRGTVLDIVG